MSIVKSNKGLDEDIFMQQFPNHEHFIDMVGQDKGLTQVTPPIDAKKDSENEK